MGRADALKCCYEIKATKNVGFASLGDPRLQTRVAVPGRRSGARKNSNDD
jgi:hypothetical protein